MFTLIHQAAATLILATTAITGSHGNPSTLYTTFATTHLHVHVEVGAGME